MLPDFSSVLCAQACLRIGGGPDEIFQQTVVATLSNVLNHLGRSGVFAVLFLHIVFRAITLCNNLSLDTAWHHQECF